MTDPKFWARDVRVTVNGQSWNPVKSALFLVMFFGFCLGLAAWRRLG